jgi:hypothetical protein
VWQNGFQTSNLVELGQRIVKVVAEQQQTARNEAAILDNRRVSELEHDLVYSAVRLPQGLCAMGSVSTIGRPQGTKNG